MDTKTSRRSTANARLFGSNATTMWFFLVLAASLMAGSTLGFSLSSTPQKSRPSSCSFTTTRLSAAADSANNKNFPPLSRDEVQAMLDTVPVYAVTEPNQEGLVLLKEKDNPKDICYFFFSPEAANTVFSPLRQKQTNDGNDADWSVSAYPLGLVWFELIKQPEEGVEYRLLPEPENLIGAQNLLKEQQKQSNIKNNKLADLFRSPFNEIPVFVDQFLRVTTEDGERVPMYLGLKDLMATCNQAIKASKGEYQAAMSAIDLGDLIDEMTKEGGNSNDYRKAIVVPPSPAEKDADEKASTSTPEPEPDAFDWDGKQAGNFRTDNSQISTPTATNDWSD